MKNYLFLIFILCFGVFNAQRKSSGREKNNDTLVVDGNKDSIKIFRPTIEDYKIFTQTGEKKLFDTVFTIDKSYEFTRYNNQDDFGKVYFPNIGSGFQSLVFEVNSDQDLSLLPTKKSAFIKNIDNINYYDVKTPTTAFVFHNGVKNGGVLQTTYTQNIGKQYNFAIEYMGLRSEGFYKRELAASSNFIFSNHFVSKNNRYELFAHYIHQGVKNEESGGIKNLENFISGDSRFRSRVNLEVNLNNTETEFTYRRYYLSHQLTLLRTDKVPLKLKHTIFHQGNKYRYFQNEAENFYTSALLPNYATYSKKVSNNLSNTFGLFFDKEEFSLDLGVRHQLIDLGTDRPISIAFLNIPKEFKENRFGLVGNMKIDLWDKILLDSDAEYSKGDEFGDYIKIHNDLRFEPIKGYFLDAEVNYTSSAPSFNYLMNTSFYQDFNYNFMNFKNQNTLEVSGSINLHWFNSSVFAKYYNIANYTYFLSNGHPNQSGSALDITQFGGEATFNYKKFHLNTRLLFQTALSNKELFPMPKFVGRANLYYQTKAFKNAAEFQTGIKAYFFSKFDSREYFPILNEFILPGTNAYSIGGKPMVDFYINMKVKRMMIYAEAQHLNRIFMDNRYYTAPYYPVHDFRVNLGLVWYLFH